MCCGFLKGEKKPEKKFGRKPDLLDVITLVAIGATAAVVVAGTLFIIKKRRAKYACCEIPCESELGSEGALDGADCDCADVEDEECCCKDDDEDCIKF